MKLRYQAAKGRRLKRNTVFVVFSLDSRCRWSDNFQKWVYMPPGEFIRDDEYLSSGFSCFTPGCPKTHRAFRRRLKQWREYLGPGVEFKFELFYRGHSIFGRT